MNEYMAFLAAFIASLLCTPLVRYGARATGAVAVPRQDRWHKKPTALFGGIAIYVGFLVGFLIAAGVSARNAPMLFESRGLGILLAATLMFVTGLVDDIVTFRPYTKLVLQGTAAAVLVSFGVIYPLTPWVPVNTLVTIFWFLALTNALNLLDNMDGVTSGVAAIAAGFLAVAFFSAGEVVLGTLCAAVAGAALGFLPYNFHPASIFMGDSGSLFLGSLLAGLAAAYPTTASTSVLSVLFVPMLIVSIPLLDTMLVTVMRTVAGRSIAQGGRDHTSHRLVAMGLSERQVALVLYTFAAAGGFVALAVQNSIFGLWLGGVFLCGLAVFAAYLGRLHSYTPEEASQSTRLTVLVSDILYKRRVLEVLLDIVLFSVAYYGAYLLRFDGSIPREQLLLLEGSLAVAVAAKSVAFLVLGVYRGVWHQVGMPDLHRIVKGAVVGSLLTLAAVVLVFEERTFARSVFIIDGILAFLLVAGSRVSFRSLDSMRRSLNTSGIRTLIYGAGRGGELLLREIQLNPDLGMSPVGFLDDDPVKWNRLIQGIPVLGKGDRLEAVLVKHRIQRVVIGTRALDRTRYRELEAACRLHGAALFQMELRIREVPSPASAVEQLTDSQVPVPMEERELIAVPFTQRRNTG